MAAAKSSCSQDPVGSKGQIKDLLTHMDPMIYLAGTADNTSEMLAYLADMDPAFHKLELVKSLRKEMRNKLGMLVESQAVDYLEQLKGKMRADNPVDVLMERIGEEEIFKDFMDEMEMSVKETVVDMSEHFDDEIVTGIFSHDDDELSYSVSPNDSNESSLNSSLNQSGLLFLHPAQYNNIAQSLLNKKDPQVLNDSLNILISVTPGEPVMQDCWPDIRKGLRDCLFEESPEVFGKALKVHCKLLTSQVQNAVKESYLNLLEALAGFYISKRHLSKIPMKGEPIDLKSCENIMRILKVLTDFQQELPLLWIRYPERYVDIMVETTFNVLSLNLGKKDNKLMSVLDVCSLVDPDILWFKRWIHGQWGRTKTFSAMKSNSMIVIHAVSYCIQYLDRNPGQIEDNNSDVLSPNMVYYLRFIQYFQLIMAVISSSDGRKLFPVNVPSRDELVTIQEILQLFIKTFWDTSISNGVVSVISSQLESFCSKDEAKCWMLCDAGIVEVLLQVLCNLDESLEGKDGKRKALRDVSPLFLHSSLNIILSVLSTQAGQKYILLGRKRKASSKSNLSTVTKRQAFEVMDLIHFILKNEDLSVKLKEKAVNVCCSLLSSPIGIHLCLEHPLIDGIIGHLQREESRLPKRLLQEDDQLIKLDEMVCLGKLQSLPLLTALLSSYKGIYLLEKEGVLPVVIKKVLPHMAENGNIDQKLLASVCSSVEGSAAVGDLGLLNPYWDIVRYAVDGEDPGQQPPDEDDKEEELLMALAPILALTGSYYGTKLIFSQKGLLKDVSHSLFSSEELLGEMHRMALHLLSSATSVLDSSVYLQSLTKYQEQLLEQQSYVCTDDASAVIIDEKSIIRNHILVKSHLLGGNGERILPPHVLESSTPNLPQLFSSYPPPKEYIPDKPIRSMHKKQNEVWRFLNDTRHGLHDIGWLNHCRKSVRSVLIAGEDIKTWLVMDIIELSACALLTSAEELLPGSPLSNATGNSVPVMSSGSPGPVSLSEYVRPDTATQSSTTHSESHLHAVDLILRYGSELQLLTGSGSFRETLLELLSYTHSSIFMSTPERNDWFTMFIFLLSGGNAERCRSVLSNVSGVLVGAVLWPSFCDSLSVTHEVLPEEIIFSSIIHNVQLVLSIEIPMLYSVLQTNDSCLWNLLGEWVRCLFLGVLPWLEVCHYVMIVLLQGPDYIVYFVVALIRHLQRIFVKYAGSHKCLTALQTTTVTGWHLGEHINFMEGLSRRHRRIILPALTSPFYNLRHEYTLRQL